jgi:hypothetical protein
MTLRGLGMLKMTGYRIRRRQNVILFNDYRTSRRLFYRPAVGVVKGLFRGVSRDNRKDVSVVYESLGYGGMMSKRRTNPRVVWVVWDFDYDEPCVVAKTRARARRIGGLNCYKPHLKGNPIRFVQSKRAGNYD